MTPRSTSLRARLTAIILGPVMTIAGLAAIWQLSTARQTASALFNDAMLTAALAVAKDVAISGGDALSPATNAILTSTSGGTVFYHVYAPDGVIVAGYATPPVGIPQLIAEISEPTFFEAQYLGRDVSGVRLQTQTEIEGFSGLFTTTVWQDSDVRAQFVQTLVLPSVVAILGLLTALALVVWFGVRIGLRPLLDLERAIAQRSSDDLSSIKRAVPEEVGGIVARLNDLFGQVTRSMTAQSEFIANAAHQLRNPIAGIQSLAEAIDSARTPEAVATRTQDLLVAVRQTSALTQQLLLYERAKATRPKAPGVAVDLNDVLQGWAEDFRALVSHPMEFFADIDVAGHRASVDAVMLKEALTNLIENAVLHGGDGVTCVRLDAHIHEGCLRLRVEDDGAGIPQDRLGDATTRFVQIGEERGSGLGLSIAQAVTEAHGGKLTLSDAAPGLRVEMTLALAQ